MITMYGIPNCDTVKKARTWFQTQGHSVVFHDFKKQGVPADQLVTWVQELGWESVVNRQGTTWRRLDEATRQGVVDSDSAIALLQAQPSAIKRPVVVWPNGLTVGFVPERWATLAP